MFAEMLMHGPNALQIYRFDLTIFARVPIAFVLANVIHLFVMFKRQSHFQMDNCNGAQGRNYSFFWGGYNAKFLSFFTKRSITSLTFTGIPLWIDNRASPIQTIFLRSNFVNNFQTF